ncbi:uncharacterized protein B0T23DRAFT_369246 [Neurospora hispaniola]|uniref:Uncharacterized protein n=1 Tax=Neurospora hispaniola TaxID=588809 RepID=A0AAJ0IEY0_9PEZI|nr:hypothetical protein B0T23DRAFT_369246 [Neurospora hispaniola]
MTRVTAVDIYTSHNAGRFINLKTDKIKQTRMHKILILHSSDSMNDKTAFTFTTILQPGGGEQLLITSNVYLYACYILIIFYHWYFRSSHSLLFCLFPSCQPQTYMINLQERFVISDCPLGTDATMTHATIAGRSSSPCSSVVYITCHCVLSQDLANGKLKIIFRVIERQDLQEYLVFSSVHILPEDLFHGRIYCTRTEFHLVGM